MDNIFAQGGVRDPLQEHLASGGASASIANSAFHGTESGKEGGGTPLLPAMPPAKVDHGHTAAAATDCGNSDGLTGGGAARTPPASGLVDGTGPGVQQECRDSSSGKKRTGRRVRFPEGSLITNKFDPPNPWINAKETCTDELCAAYQAGCALMKVKPSQNIIQQLQTVKDFTVRAESLNLQGEKLDLKTVETLEEVFKRVQFNTIDVESTGMDDEATMAMCDMVEFYQSSCKLIYAGNRSIGFRGWQATSRLLRRTPCLHTFDARNTCWTEHSMPAMSRAMRVDSSITALHLEACNLSGRPHFLLMSALRTNSTLRELFLADNRLMPSDAIHIGALLRHNSGLKLLDLRNNNIQDGGVNNISNGLAAQTKGGLSTLVLWNNHITHNGVGHIGKALIKTTNLETLNLGQNNLGTDGIHMLKEGLMKNKSLMRLGMYCCRLSDEGAVALAEYLADNCYLMRLDLRENDIRTGGMMALSLSLKVNTILLRLDLDKDIKRESLKGYEELQQSLLSEICNHLAFNRQILEQRQKEEEERAKNATLSQAEDLAATDKDNNGAINGDDSANEQQTNESVLHQEESAVRDNRDPLMGIESSREQLVVLGSRPKSTRTSRDGNRLQNEDTVQKQPDENSVSKESVRDQISVPVSNPMSVPLPLPVSLTSSATQVQSVSNGPSEMTTPSIESSLEESSIIAETEMSSASVASSNPGVMVPGLGSQDQALTGEDQSSPPGIRINDSIKLLAYGSKCGKVRSGSLTKIEIPTDESQLLHSDSIDVESPTSPHKPLELSTPTEEAVNQSDAPLSGEKALVDRALEKTRDSREVPSPDKEPFGRGVPLNIDGKIGNGLLNNMSDSLFMPLLQTAEQCGEPELMPSPDLEKDIDHFLAAAHGL